MKHAVKHLGLPKAVVERVIELHQVTGQVFQAHPMVDASDILLNVGDPGICSQGSTFTASGTATACDMYFRVINNLFFLSRLIIVIFVVLLIDSTRLNAETYLRICKNAAIYYYFSDRGENRTRPVTITQKTLLKRSPRAREKSVQELQPAIQEASSRYGLPASLITALIRVESNFNPGATSPKGAQGLMQLMPATAADLEVTNAYDVRENILAGSRYLYLLLEKFNHKLPHALAAYNAGPQRVEKWQAVPPIAETEEFVRDVCVQFLKYETKKSSSP